MTVDEIHYDDCVVLCGPALQPFACRRFSCRDGRVERIEQLHPITGMEKPGPVIIPGLVNSHTHIGDSFLADGAASMTLEEGFFRPDGYKYRQLAQVDADQQYAAIRDSLGCMAGSGTVAHIDFREQGLHGTRLLRRAAEETGLDSIILGQIPELPFSEDQLRANAAPLSPDAEATFAALISEADGISESTINDLSDPAWRRLCELTESARKLRAIHCLENAGYRETSEAISGRGDLERALDVYQPHLVVHLTVADNREISLLARSGAVAVLNPRANAALGLPLPPIRDLLEAGVPLLLGTDNGLLNSPNLLPELDFTYRLAKSQYGNAIDPPPEKILAMATSNIRFLPGVCHPGYLEEGLPASFAVIDGSAPHLRWSRNLLASLLCRVTPADVAATFRQGRPLHQRAPIGP